MILSWFTQPPGAFASYYQYDTSTREFSRIRLELGRTSQTRTNDTFVSYKSGRAVGFSDQRLSTSDLGRWSVDDDGQLCFDDVALPSDKPSAGDRVYDTSDPGSFVHRGNAVTDTPALPEGIAPKHLALLANDSMLTRKTIALTGGDAEASALSAKIKGEVCRVLEVEDFATVTDDMILAKLTEQVQIQRDYVTSDSVKSLDGALTEARSVSDVIIEQIDNGIIVPDEAFTKACASLQTAITKAQAATRDEINLDQALAEIGSAQEAVTAAVKNIDTAKFEAVSKQLDMAKESLAQAQSHAEDWQMAEAEYEKLAEATTIDEYESELFDPAAEEVI